MSTRIRMSTRSATVARKATTVARTATTAATTTEPRLFGSGEGYPDAQAPKVAARESHLAADRGRDAVDNVQPQPRRSHGALAASSVAFAGQARPTIGNLEPGLRAIRSRGQRDG